MITEDNAPDSFTILVNSHFGGWPPWSGRLTAPLLCMKYDMSFINNRFLARADDEYYLSKIWK